MENEKLKENLRSGSENKRDEVKSNIEKIINVVKNKKIQEGVIEETPQVIIHDVDFAGKKLKISKSFYKEGKQKTIEAGTKWEDVSPYFRKNVRFSQKDFI